MGAVQTDCTQYQNGAYKGARQPSRADLLRNRPTAPRFSPQITENNSL